MRALLALHHVDLVPTSARRVLARCRHPHVCTAVVRHALARTPEGLNPLVLLCSPGSKVLPFLGMGLMANTHRREPGMPVPPACLRRSGPFPLRRRARPRTSPLGQKHARAGLSLRMVLWPCPSRVGCDPVALVRTVLSLPLPSPPWTSVPPRRVSPELVVAEPGSRPRATPFFTQTKP
jgi:hypothetical protein